MTTNEWSLVRRVAAILLVAALFPIGVIMYRVFLTPDSTVEEAATLTPILYTLVPDSANPGSLATPTFTPFVLVVPHGWTNYPVPDQNFSIALPETWQPLPVGSQDLDASLQAIRQSNPELANTLGASAQELIRSGVKFWAYDPDPDSLKSHFATNLTVTRQAVPNDVSFDAYVLVNVNQIEQLSSRQGAVTHQRLVLSSRLAEKIRYNLVSQAPDGTSVTSALTLYLLLNRDSAYVLTFATRLDQIDHYAATFDQSAATFRFLAP